MYLQSADVFNPDHPELARHLSDAELERFVFLRAQGIRSLLSCPHCTLRLEMRDHELVHAFNGKSLCREGAPYKAEHPRVVAK